MTYLIPAAVLILVLALVIYLGLAKKKRRDTAEPAAVPEQEHREEKPAAPVPEIEAAGRSDSPDARESAGEEFAELSFDSQRELAGKEEDGEFIELTLDMEEKAAEGAPGAEGGEESEVAPALADSLEKSGIAVEEAPEELTEKLDYYFGEEEEAPPVPAGAEEIAEEEEGGEVIPGEPAGETHPPAEAEEPAAPVPPDQLSLDSYGNRLRNLEENLRRQLEEAAAERDGARRAVLEAKLLAVCERQAEAEQAFARYQQLLETASDILARVQEETRLQELPGIDTGEAERLLRQGELAEAESMLAEANLQIDEPETAAKVYSLCGRLAEERLDYESAFEDYRNAAAAKDDDEAYLVAAGRIARILGNDEDAQTWLEAVVRTGLEKGEQTLLQSEAQHELARICMRQGEKEKAGALFKRALEIRENVLGDGHPDLGPLMHDYAALYESNGMYEQAEALYGRALSVMEKQLGGSHPRLGATLNRLAGLYEELEEGDKSLPLYERALAIRERVLGEEHHDVGIILNSLADLLRRRGKTDAAEPMFKRSLAIAEKELGRDHPNLTVILNNLAELYSQMGREEEAAAFQERAFSLFELPGMDGDFVEMEKDQAATEDDKNTRIAGK
jgi:tetratricopeptide (TPR) repeat protein